MGPTYTVVVSPALQPCVTKGPFSERSQLGTGFEISVTLCGRSPSDAPKKRQGTDL